jgi:hypothetical protein
MSMNEEGLGEGVAPVSGEVFNYGASFAKHDPEAVARAYAAYQESQKPGFYEARDKSITDAYAELKERGVVARAEILSEGSEPGSSEDVGATLYELRTVVGDSSVQRYDDPSDEELLEVLAKAEAYDGDWFHSYVKMTSVGGWTPLQQRVKDLPSSAGVYRTYSFTGPDDLFADFGLSESKE